MREDDGAAATPMTGRETGRAPGEREFWCNHPRRGQVSFKPNQIEPVRAVVVVETLEEVALSQDIPLEVNGVPVSHLSVNDFSNLVIEMRTINDLILYLDARCSICPELQRTVGIEKAIFEFYVLYRGSPREADGMHDILKELCERRDEVEEDLSTAKSATTYRPRILNGCRMTCPQGWTSTKKDWMRGLLNCSTLLPAEETTS